MILITARVSRTEPDLPDRGTRSALFQAELNQSTTGDAMPRIHDQSRFQYRVFIGGGIEAGQAYLELTLSPCSPWHPFKVDGDNRYISRRTRGQSAFLLIPLHRVFQRGHRPGRAIEVAAIDVQLRHHTVASGCGVRRDIKITGFQRTDSAASGADPATVPRRPFSSSSAIRCREQDVFSFVARYLE